MAIENCNEIINEYLPEIKSILEYAIDNDVTISKEDILAMSAAYLKHEIKAIINFKESTIKALSVMIENTDKDISFNNYKEYKNKLFDITARKIFTAIAIDEMITSNVSTLLTTYPSGLQVIASLGGEK